MNKIEIAHLSDVDPLKPFAALVANVDLVVIRYEDQVSVLYGRCHHRGAMLADGHIEGENLICGVHGWDYRYRTGISEYENDQALKQFQVWIENDRILVDEEEISSWERDNPQPYQRDAYLGQYADIHGSEEEPDNHFIQDLARNGLGNGHHGPMAAMGVPRQQLPQWSDLQIQTAQLERLPLMEDAKVGTELVLGPAAKRRSEERRGGKEC